MGKTAPGAGGFVGECDVDETRPACLRALFRERFPYYGRTSLDFNRIEAMGRAQICAKVRGSDNRGGCGPRQATLWPWSQSSVLKGLGGIEPDPAIKAARCPAERRCHLG
jgi:hypothetical protein